MASPSPLPSLSTLVSFLLAAKRSLNSADRLARANEIVDSTKHALVHYTAVEARTRFLLCACLAQLSVLDELHRQLRSILDETSSEFHQVVTGVKTAETRLNEILVGLRGTIVNANLRPQGEESKNLLDFVEATEVQRFLEEIWAGIKESQAARDQFSATVTKFQVELTEARSALSHCDQSRSNGDQAAFPSLLQALENSAHAMAQNFEALVNHYDLCLNTLKHTEGAGAALHQAPGNDLSDDQNAALAQELEFQTGAVSPKDHAHVLSLLSDDAHQVEEVIEDIRESLVDMESSYASALCHIQESHRNYRRAVATFDLLESLGVRLGQYTTQSHLFVLHTDDEKARIAEHHVQLGELTRFYSGFLGAYDSLIIEVGRRKDVARRMKRVQEDALAKLDALYNEDIEERDNFKASQGEFLPVDIWPGLMAPAPRYEVSLVEGQGSVPDISASVVQKAIRRVKARPQTKD